MSRINAPRVIAGGLLAGLVFNVFDYVWNTFVLAEGYRANLTRLGLDPAAMETGAGIATWVVIDFLFGLLVVCTYAAIRPRFGPGPKTAVVAGLVIWLAPTLVLFGLSQGGMIDMSLLVKSSLLSLIGMVVGSVAGAWVYREVAA
jgi:hypothetical protein